MTSAGPTELDPGRPRGSPRKSTCSRDSSSVRSMSGETPQALASGREALSELKRRPNHYDVALVDWNLPGISGRDVILDLKERSPSTRVLRVWKA